MSIISAIKKFLIKRKIARHISRGQQYASVAGALMDASVTAERDATREYIAAQALKRHHNLPL